MKTRIKFWGGLTLLIILVFLIVNIKATLIVIAIVTLILCLTGLVFDGDSFGDLAPNEYPENHYDFCYFLNIVYWINMFNCWLDKFDKDE